MKKILSILLAVAVVFSFAACSNGPEYTFYGKEVASVTLSSAPAYLKGETVNPSDVSLRVVFDDGTETTVTGQDVGMKTSDGKFVMDEDGLTFDFNYGVDKDNKAQKHSIEIKPVTLTGLQIDPADAAKAIAKNATTVDTTGLVYTAVYDGGSKEISETLAESLVTGLGFSVPTGLATAEVEDELTITPDTVSGNVKPVMTSDWVVKVVEDPKAVVGVRVEQDVDAKEVFLLSKAGTKLSDIPLIVTEVLADGTDGEVLEATTDYTEFAFDLYETSYVLKATDENNTYSGSLKVGTKVYKFDNLSFEFTTDYPKSIAVTKPEKKYVDKDTVDVTDFKWSVTTWQSEYDYATNKVTTPSFSPSSVIEISENAYIKEGTQTQNEKTDYSVTIKYVGTGKGAIEFTSDASTSAGKTTANVTIAAK